MTDRPERPTTIVPPEDTSPTEPPTDRDKTTDRPIPVDQKPPEDLLKFSETVFTRLHDIEDLVKGLSGKLSKLDELHALLFGTPKKPGGKPEKNIVSALHDLNTSVAVAGTNAELVAEQQKSLPELVAQELANKVLELFQGEMRAQGDRIKSLEAIVDELQHTGPNGRGNTR